MGESVQHSFKMGKNAVIKGKKRKINDIEKTGCILSDKK
jgi:hypothetical protein